MFGLVHLLGIERQATKMNMQNCWSFSCCFSWTLGSSSKCGQLSLFYRYYFGRCSSELAQLVLFSFSRGRSTCYFDRLHNFSVTIPRCYKGVYVNSFFLKQLDSRVPVCFNVFVLLFLVTPYLIVAIHPCIEYGPIKKKK